MEEEKIEYIETDEIPEIELPFEHKKFDLLEWLYDHRIGVFATLGGYFIIFMMFLLVRISTSTPNNFEGLMIDLSMVEQLEEIRDDMEDEIIEKLEETEENETEEIFDEEVLNDISNEGAEEGSESVEDFQTLLDQFELTQRQMESNRAAYEQGMAEISAMKEQAANRPKLGEVEQAGQDANLSGTVTVSYVLINPIRHSRQLVVPSYLCMGGGKVVIRVTVNPKGEVTDAKVKSGGDECMQQSALKSAMASLFTPSTQAAERHRGTITYHFVPQEYRNSSVEVYVD